MNSSSMLMLSDKTNTGERRDESNPSQVPVQQPRIIGVELPRRRLGGSLRDVELLQRTQTGGLSPISSPGDESLFEAQSAAYVVVDRDGATREILNDIIYGRAVAEKLYFYAGLVEPENLDPWNFTMQMLEFLQHANPDSMRAFLTALQELVTEGTDHEFDVALMPLLDQAYFLKQAS